MADKPLPKPVTYADEYAHAIATELRTLNGNFSKFFKLFAAQDEPESGEVTLKEPATEKPAHRDAKKADADKALADAAEDADAPLTVETKEPGKAAKVETVDPAKPVGAERKN